MMLSFANAASAADATTPALTWQAPSAWFIYGVIIAVFLGAILALLITKAALSKTTWSLSDALSEDVEVSDTTKDANGVKQPRLDATGKAVPVTIMVASSSRFIAFVGIIVILMMFLGFGTFALYGVAKTGKMPDSTDTIVKFLVAGMTLFAPYVVNKFSAMFQSLVGGK